MYVCIGCPVQTKIPHLRNCAFHVPGHKALLSPESTAVAVPPSEKTSPGIDVLPYILLPLAGPEEYDLEVRVDARRHLRSS